MQKAISGKILFLAYGAIARISRILALSSALFVGDEIILFDTDVLIWFLRGNEKAACLLEREPLRAVSQVSWMELVQGTRDKRELAMLKSSFPLTGLEMLPLSEAIGNRAVVYMEKYALKNGLMIADALVGATAAEHGLTLTTANVKYFRHLDDVTVNQFKP